MEVMATAAAAAPASKNGEEKGKKIVRIQVSKNKKPLIFYLNLAKKYIKRENDVELCALGMAIPTVIILSEILKRNGWAIEKNIRTSTVGSKEDKGGRGIRKAKLEILLGKDGDLEMDQNDIAAKLEKGLTLTEKCHSPQSCTANSRY